MWNDNFWVWKEKNCQPIMFYVAKFFFNSEEVLLEKKLKVWQHLLPLRRVARAEGFCSCSRGAREERREQIDTSAPRSRTLTWDPCPTQPQSCALKKKSSRRPLLQYCKIGGKQTMVNPDSTSQPPLLTASSLSWKLCASCGGKIADRFLLCAMDSYWHSRCLKCSCCQAQLGDIGTSCYTKSSMILCRNDYIRLFGNSTCSACGLSIPCE